MLSSIIAGLVLSSTAIYFGPSKVNSLMIDKGIELRVKKRAEFIRWINEEKLRVLFCGTGSPIADKSQANSCTAVMGGGLLYIIDAGPGSTANLTTWGFPIDKINAVLLTHFHSDHLGDLGELKVQSSINGRKKALNVLGPPGTAAIVSNINNQYTPDQIYRSKHHGKDMPKAGSLLNGEDFDTGTEEEITLFQYPIKITAFKVSHQPVENSFGYRIEYKGRVVTLSGDTIKCQSLINNTIGSDVLIQDVIDKRQIRKISNGLQKYNDEGPSRRARLADDATNYHASPQEAAEIKEKSKVPTMILTHITPPAQYFLQKYLLLQQVCTQGYFNFFYTLAAWYTNSILIASDGMHLTLEPERNGVKPKPTFGYL